MSSTERAAAVRPRADGRRFSALLFGVAFIFAATGGLGRPSVRAQQQARRGYDDLVRSALLHVARGDHRDAHRDLRQALEHYRERPRAYRVLAELRRVEGAPREAIALFNRCAELAEARIGQEGTDPGSLLFTQGACLFGVADTLERVASADTDWRAVAVAWRTVLNFAEQQANSELGPWAEARLVAIAAAHPDLAD